MRPLNYVCAFFQPIIPLVYDNTMTLVECVNKLRYKVNEMIKAYNTVLPEMQNIDNSVKAAEEAAAFVQEYAKLPYILKRQTFVGKADGITATQVNTLYSDNLQVIELALEIDKDITAGQTYTVPAPLMVNGLTKVNGGFTAKLSEVLTFEDTGSTYGGNYINDLNVTVAPMTRKVDPINNYPDVKLTFSSTVNHVKGVLYAHSVMKAGV